MLQLGFMILTLVMGVLVESFPVAQADPGHHQVCLQAAMADDGSFAVAWVDSVHIPGYLRLNLFIRFFDYDGSPLSEAYQITKLADTNWICHPSLDMDTAGNTVLVWAEAAFQLELDKYIRFQAFAPDASPAGSAQTLTSQVNMNSFRPIGLSLANNGEFAVVWTEDWFVWLQRFNAEGNPKDSAFLVRDSVESGPPWFFYPEVALKDAGDVVVTWLDCNETAKMYPKYQVFDANDESILPWEPFGHRVDDGDSVAGACSPKPHWLDDDRFVAFWSDYTAPRPTAAIPLLGRVFSNRGLSAHSIKTVIWGDSIPSTLGGYHSSFFTAVSPDERFAYTHTRTYCDFPDTAEPWKERMWAHGAGILGEVVNNEPWRRTTLFEYTPPWGADTVNSIIDNWLHVQPSAAAVCDDSIVWVYSRLNTDSIFEAYVLITDWDMGVGVTEQPVVSEPSNWEVVTSIGPQIVLRYSDCPEGFHAAIYDAAGRKVSEIHNANASGTISWGECYGPGVYFIKPLMEGVQARKVIITR